MLSHIDPREMPRALQHLLSQSQPEPAAALPRRSFLKLAGAGGLAIGAFPMLAVGQGAMAAAADTALKPTQMPSAFVQIAPNGEVMVTINRLEFGQGVQTALPMILAEELDADWSLVRSRMGSSDPAYVDPMFGMHITGGSNSIKHSFTQYRELGARARAMLMSAAAARWGVDVSALRTQAGSVIGAGGLKLGYGELAEAAMAQPVPDKVILKDPKTFRLIGQPINRLDAKAKSSGQQSFGIDVHRPGQLTAVVAHPPVFGAKVASVDDKAALAIAGVKAVLRVPLAGGAQGVAVVADAYWPAKQGRDALKVSWDTSAVEKVDSARQLSQYRELAKQPGPRQFDADMAPLAKAPKRIDAEFVFPYLAHAPMEPLNCTVELADGQAQLRLRACWDSSLNKW
jgi:isoquinoline 1-oxidoreductase beta subunit